LSSIRQVVAEIYAQVYFSNAVEFNGYILMTTKATEKIIDALTQLVEGFAELQQGLEEDFDPDQAEDEKEAEDDDEPSTDIEEALVTEVRSAVEAVIENEDCAPEDLASIVSALTDALEEIDPELFASQEESEDEEDDLDEEDDDLDLDDDDDYEEEDEDEDENEEDEEEDEDEEDDD
jgi:hypothetical protein